MKMISKMKMENSINGHQITLSKSPSPNCPAMNTIDTSFKSSTIMIGKLTRRQSIGVDIFVILHGLKDPINH